MNYEQFKETEKYEEMNGIFISEESIEEIFDQFGEETLDWSKNQIRFAEKVSESDLDLEEVMNVYEGDYYIDDNDIAWLSFGDRNDIDYAAIKSELDSGNLKDFDRCDCDDLEMITFAFKEGYSSMSAIGNSDYPQDVKEALIEFDVSENELPEHELKECTGKHIKLYALALEKGKEELLFPKLNVNDMSLERDFESVDLLIEALKNNEQVELFADPRLDEYQIEEIRKGIEAGIDVEKYNDSKISDEEMKKTRLQLVEEKKLNVSKDELYSQKYSVENSESKEK